MIGAFAVDQKVAGSDRLQTREHAQQRGLAAARWPDENNKFARRDVEIDVLKYLGVAKIFGEIAERYAFHALCSNYVAEKWKLPGGQSCVYGQTAPVMPDARSEARTRLPPATSPASQSGQADRAFADGNSSPDRGQIDGPTPGCGWSRGTQYWRAHCWRPARRRSLCRTR